MSYIGKTPTAVPLTSSDIPDSTISQADLVDQAVNEAKMQVSNSPTNGYFLSAQSGNTGGMTWAEAGGGAWVLIDTQTVSGTPTTIEPGAVFSATYDTYVVVIRRYNNVSGGGLHLQVGTSSGYTTSGYFWNASGVGGTGNSLLTGSSSDTKIDLLGGTSSTYHCNSSQDCVSGVIWFHNPFNTVRTSIHGELAWENASDFDAHINNISAHPHTNTQHDRWKLICPSTSQTFEATTIIQTFGVVNA